MNCTVVAGGSISALCDMHLVLLNSFLKISVIPISLFLPTKDFYSITWWTYCGLWNYAMQVLWFILKCQLICLNTQLISIIYCIITRVVSIRNTNGRFDLSMCITTSLFLGEIFLFISFVFCQFNFAMNELL